MTEGIGGRELQFSGWLWATGYGSSWMNTSNEFRKNQTRSGSAVWEEVMGGIHRKENILIQGYQIAPLRQCCEVEHLPLHSQDEGA